MKLCRYESSVGFEGLRRGKVSCRNSRFDVWWLICHFGIWLDDLPIIIVSSWTRMLIETVGSNVSFILSVNESHICAREIGASCHLEVSTTTGQNTREILDQIRECRPPIMHFPQITTNPGVQVGCYKAPCVSRFHSFMSQQSSLLSTHKLGKQPTLRPSGPLNLDKQSTLLSFAPFSLNKWARLMNGTPLRLHINANLRLSRLRPTSAGLGNLFESIQNSFLG
jgi:hypothetical protein